MISDAVRGAQDRILAVPASLEAVLRHWDGAPHSALLHHGADCCERAKLWLLAMDASMRGTAAPHTGPRWLRVRYKWGPTVWPLHWCEAVGRKELDCGALAWMTREVYAARNVKAFPVQLVQRYSGDAASHWAARWTEAGASTHWLGNSGYVYHEACAVAGPADSIRVWDPSAGWWVEEPTDTIGYGTVVALRLLDPLRIGGHPGYRWGRAEVVPGQWTVLEH